VARATPLSPVYGHREMANRFRHYERWSSPPQGFVALGDAVCRFNPIYGQGMTSAVLSARLLGRCVSRHGVIAPALPGAFFRAQARLLADPWSMATGADFRVPGVDGKRPPLAGVVSLYMDALFDAVGDDVTLRRRLGEVIHMLRPARALFAPRVVAAVLRHRLARRARRPSGGGVAPIPARPAA
jgi:2-polyprenyl-6-methoxyphenol hydroxylase-like FAD-dependent oxidoreductase